MLERIQDLIAEQVDFAIETMLATRSYASLICQAQAAGYKVLLAYFWLQSPEVAAERVKRRVSLGGHNIPPDVIERRYRRGIEYLIKIYVGLVDEWSVFDNSVNPRIQIAGGTLSGDIEIYISEKWGILQNIAHESRR